MPEVTAPYEPGAPCWADLTVPDPQAALDFYRDLFGWQGERGPAETGGYAVCTLNGLPVAGIGPAMEPGTPSAWTTYLASDDVRATVAAVTAAGGKALSEVMDVMTLGSLAVIADPVGAVLGVWQRKDFIGARIVNEFGAMVWNECSSADPAASAAFYTEVFGVEYVEEEGLPGYREMSVGGHEVAGLRRLPDPPAIPEVPSYWLAYFAVDDAASTVAAAVRAGADLIVPLIDTEVGRMATIRDPWGATFAIITPMPPA